MTRLAANAFATVALLANSLRWLRVSQREHYIPGYATRFAVRWWRSRPMNLGVLVLAVAMSALAFLDPVAGLAAAGLLLAFPVGLSYRGRTSRLAWTARMRRLGAVVWCELLLVAIAGWLVPFGAGFLVVGVILVPALVDLAALAMAPIERRGAERFVGQAREKLASVRPRVIAVTGSFGKTTTKNYIRQLLASTHQVVASPASFNNMLGLARTVNEHLAPGTEILIAEMGDYGPGEIAAMCKWTKPEVGVVTAVGYEHFERFGSMESIAASKREVFDGVSAAVGNVDSPYVAEMLTTLEGCEIYNCSTVDEGATVAVIAEGDELRVLVRGQEVKRIRRLNRHASNVASAVGAALAVGAAVDKIAARLDELESPEHRAGIEKGESGISIIDDTYNSNPVGAAAALGLMSRAGATGSRIVVTPGMVEMGVEQYNLNREFADEAGRVADTLVVVGRTNRRALIDGAGENCNVVKVDRRDEATKWVRENFGAGDIVLYENDLPDHFP